MTAGQPRAGKAKGVALQQGRHFGLRLRLPDHMGWPQSQRLPRTQPVSPTTGEAGELSPHAAPRGNIVPDRRVLETRGRKGAPRAGVAQSAGARDQEFKSSLCLPREGLAKIPWTTCAVTQKHHKKDQLGSTGKGLRR